MVEEISYQLIKKIGSIELRQYPKIILAEVNGKDDTSAFNILYQYISGYNITEETIKMTAPVITSTKIKMTRPVISKGSTFAFVLPKQFTEITTPKPKNKEITIRIEPEKTLAVLRFSGRTTKKRVETFEKELYTQLEKIDIKIKGNPFLMRYNSPFTPSFIRRNELGVEVEYE